MIKLPDSTRIRKEIIWKYGIMDSYNALAKYKTFSLRGKTEEEIPYCFYIDIQLPEQRASETLLWGCDGQKATKYLRALDQAFVGENQ